MSKSDTADHLDTASTELLLLLPRLEDAMEKDSAPTEERTAASGSPALSSPINPVVLDATVRLRVEIPMVDSRARSRLGEQQKDPDLETCVAAVKALYLRLEAIDTGEARRYADAVFGWHRLARKAIGLIQPATRLGRTCPLHDSPSTELLVLGAEGKIQHVQPGTREAIAWRRAETIWCPHCRASWAKPEFPLLGRLIEDRDVRLKESAS